TGECVRYRQQVLQVYLPPPPAPWADLRRRMTEIDRSLAVPSLWERLCRRVLLPFTRPTWLVPSTVALVVLLMVAYQFQHAPSVQAAALLKKAVAAAETRPNTPRRIQIRSRRHRVTRVIGKTTSAAATTLPEAPEAASLQAMFLAAHYSWEDPLSARSYQEWRDQLREKQDEVTPVDGSVDHPSYYQIRTSTRIGELAEATLRLDARDFHPTGQRLEFRNREWIEITELSSSAEPDAVASTTESTESGDAPPQPAPQPALTPAPTPPPVAASPGDELQVLAALHQVGADLGDPVEVRRNGSRILVTGVGVPPERRQRIQQVLASLPRVVVEFSDPAAHPPAEPPSAAGVTARAELPGLQARLEEQVGGRVYFEQLASQALDMGDSVMSRVYALRRLADRFPPAAEAGLGVQEQQLLRRLEQEHAGVLARQTVELQRLLDPVLASLGAKTALAPGNPITAGSWQAATEKLFHSARNVETLLAAMFAGASSPASEGRLPQDLLNGLLQLHAASDSYLQLVAAVPASAAK
ncbi:MAG TPA: hypothetical protein VG672_08805, partial [Bryobacteraceae bacterium]|nr:hypothetical protein [Bryobacteraceae bacterium]